MNHSTGEERKVLQSRKWSLENGNQEPMGLWASSLCIPGQYSAPYAGKSHLQEGKLWVTLYSGDIAHYPTRNSFKGISKLVFFSDTSKWNFFNVSKWICQRGINTVRGSQHFPWGHVFFPTHLTCGNPLHSTWRQCLCSLYWTAIMLLATLECLLSTAADFIYFLAEGRWFRLCLL